MRALLIVPKAALVSAAFAIALAATAAAYPVTCVDGTTSDAGGKQGACSHHGGVAGGAPSSGGGTTPVVPTLPPPDLTAPTVTVATTTPATAGAGRPFTPPAITVTDNVAWPAASYVVTVDWGDGTTSPVPFAGVPVALIPVPVTLPPHTYVAPGSFAVTATSVDPAANATTQPVTTATILPPLAPGQGFPHLTGTPKVGRTLTCVAGGWGDANAMIQFRWTANGTRIPGFSGRTFRVRRRDQGRKLSCQVIESNAAFTARATSNALRIRTARSPA